MLDNSLPNHSLQSGWFKFILTCVYISVRLYFFILDRHGLRPRIGNPLINQIRSVAHNITSSSIPLIDEEPNALWDAHQVHK